MMKLVRSNRKLRILFFIEYFQPDMGYQEYFLARELTKLGHTVTVVTSDHYFPFPEYHHTYGPKFGPRKRTQGRKKERAVTVWRLPLAWELGAGALSWVRGVASTLKILKPDLVIADGLFNVMAPYMAYLAHRQQFCLTFDNHAALFNSNLASTLPKRIYMALFSVFIPYIKNNTASFSAIGKSEATLLSQTYHLSEKLIEIFPLAADTDQFRPALRSTDKLRQKLGLSAQDVVIIYAGKVTPEKDLPVLLEAVQQLTTRHPQVKLLILGDSGSEYVVKLKKKYLSNQIIWLPLVPNQKLAEYLMIGDIGVWPGNTSNTIQEALAVGLPIVVPKETTSGQNTDYLTAADNGLQFRRGDTAGLTNQLNSLIKDNKLRKQMGQSSRELAVSQFSWQSLAHKYEQYLLKVYQQWQRNQ